MINRSEIATGFREFLNDKIDTRFDAYDNDHEYVLGQIFMLVKESVHVLSGEGQNQRMEFSFPIAKVLQVGKHWRGTGWSEALKTQGLKAGDLIRLRDNECKTILNPGWAAWKAASNEVKDGNMEMIGEAPPMYHCNMRSVFGRRVFNPDPFNLRGDVKAWSMDMFYFDQANVITKILDPDMLLGMFLQDVVDIHKNQN